MITMNFKEFPIVPLCSRLLIASIVIHSLALFIFFLRITSRFLTRIRPGLEDLFIGFSITSSTAILALFTFLVRSGIGYLATETLVNYGFNGKANFANEIIYGFGVACARVGVLLYYIRAFASPQLQLTVKIFMFVSTVLIIAITLWDVFTCNPVALNWDLKLNGTCGDRRPPYDTAAAVSIVSDVGGLILLLPLIWTLHTTVKKKAGLTALFAVGISTVGIAIWRLAALQNTVTDVRPVIITTAILEIDFIVICSSIPIIYPLFLKCINRPSTISDSSRESKFSRMVRSISPFKSLGSFNPIENAADSAQDGFALDHFSTPLTRSEN
ncbi:hypothetical protein F4678DRAFT_429451 [Xylaria arbuscula]|nr:hypothetical protein F4678DRAFT_429451 [Xylaria arbuscula]